MAAGPRRATAFAFVFAVLAATATSGCGSTIFGQGNEVGTPRGAVAAYFDASVAGDCRLASSLATPDVVRQGLWCADPRVLSYGEITDGELVDVPNERWFVVDGVVIGGTNLELLGLQAGENSILVQVLQDDDGTWRVSQINARQALFSRDGRSAGIGKP
jgi:hypothetical protein